MLTTDNGKQCDYLLYIPLLKKNLSDYINIECLTNIYGLFD